MRTATEPKTFFLIRLVGYQKRPGGYIEFERVHEVWAAGGFWKAGYEAAALVSPNDRAACSSIHVSVSGGSANFSPWGEIDLETGDAVAR